MATLRRITLITVIVLSCLSLYGQHPNVARGFQPDKVYQFADIDSVNLFNGNVTLTIPIGPRYGGNGALQYGLVLSYNSKSWDREIETYPTCNPNQTNCNADWSNKPYIRARPSRRSNAGMGWLLSLGRLVSASDPSVYPGPAGSNPPWWRYESPDGAEHLFPMTDSTDGTVRYTTDGSYLRLKVPGGGATYGTYEVHFPDGMIHTFEWPSGAGLYSPRLIEIRDPFGNHLQVSYGATTWTLTEYDAANTSVRAHTIYLRNLQGTEAPSPDAPANYSWVIDKIELAKFAGGFATYQFNYTTDQIPYSTFGDWRGDAFTPNPKVPRLRSIDLPESMSWQFDYHTAGDSAIQKLTYPTKGTIEWTYKAWVMPTAGCRPVPWVGGDDASPPFTTSEGVDVKTVTSSGAPAALWHYGQNPELLSSFLVTCENWDGSSVIAPKKQQSHVFVEAPDGSKTDHYFSIWPYPKGTGNSLFDQSEYGLPYTRDVGTGTDGKCSFESGALCLSSKQSAWKPNNPDLPPDVGNLATGQWQTRSTYVRYEGEHRDPSDESDQDRREVESRVVFQDDGDRYIHTTRSQYDGLGHFRTTTTTTSWGTDSPKRIETTNYNPTKTAVVVDPTTWQNTPANNRPSSSQKWILGLFDKQTRSDGQSTATSELWFDGNTGALKRQRILRGLDGVQSTADLIAAFDRSDCCGNVTQETFYGGDYQSVNLGVLSGLTLPAQPEFRIAHSYQYGTEKTTTYRNAAGTADVLSTRNATIDQPTGLPKIITDPSGIKVTYDYDSLGRLKSVTPDGAASMSYAYTPATSTTSARVTETVKNLANVTLQTRMYDYDGIGRLFKEWVGMPAGVTSRRETTFDVAGRKSTVSELGTDTTLPITQYVYDGWGRPRKVTAPDGSTTSYSYQGTRIRTRTSSISMSPTAADTTVSTEETYDPFGRLTQVTEGSGPTTASAPTGASVITRYKYDANDHLIGVSMGRPASTTQLRTFDYDGRGFLRWESQPESAMTSYTYDSRGHVRTKDQSAAQSLFDLEYTYDAAERFQYLKGRNPDNPGVYRTVKEFAFGTTNGTFQETPTGPTLTDLSNGKVTHAIRYNYGTVDEPVYKVDDRYVYADTPGRLTHRVTKISKILYGVETDYQTVTTSTQYDDLGLTKKIGYPMCLECGTPAAPDRSTMQYTYDAGRLLRVTGFVDQDITYWPNGMRNVLPHSNGIADTQAVSGMARPSSLSFGQYERCTHPTITTQPANKTIASGGSATLSVVVDGKPPFRYEWYNSTDSVQICDASMPCDQASITVTPAHDTEYNVVVRNDCGTVASHVVKVSIGSCPAPSAGAIDVVSLADGWRLVPHPMAGTGATYTWRQQPAGTIVGTTETLTIGLITTDTQYSLTVQDSCGTATGSATVRVPIQITSSGLTATVNQWSPLKIRVQWPPVTGTASYVVQRRSGTDWVTLDANFAGTTYDDSAIVANRTYAYRVYAKAGGLESKFTNSDVATTRTFTKAVAATAITAAPVNAMLEAVNSVRAAAGWPALTWTNVLATNDPVPAPQNAILARHITSCRARMNEALQALGVYITPFALPDLNGMTVRAAEVNELQERAD